MVPGKVPVTLKNHKRCGSRGMWRLMSFRADWRGILFDRGAGEPDGAGSGRFDGGHHLSAVPCGKARSALVPKLPLGKPMKPRCHAPRKGICAYPVRLCSGVGHFDRLGPVWHLSPSAAIFTILARREVGTGGDHLDGAWEAGEGREAAPYVLASPALMARHSLPARRLQDDHPLLRASDHLERLDAQSREWLRRGPDGQFAHCVSTP